MAKGLRNSGSQRYRQQVKTEGQAKKQVNPLSKGKHINCFFKCQLNVTNLVFCLVPNFNSINECHYRPKMPYVIVEGILSSSSGDLNFARPSSSGGSTPDRKPAFQVAVSGLKGNFF